MLLYLVGRVHGTVDEEVKPDTVVLIGVNGVFENEQDAIDACILPFDFVAPIEMNKNYNGHEGEWPGTYFPITIKSITQEGPDEYRVDCK